MICTHLKKDPKNGPHPQFLELSHCGSPSHPGPGARFFVFFRSAATPKFFAQPCFRSIGLAASVSLVLLRIQPAVRG